MICVALAWGVATRVYVCLCMGLQCGFIFNFIYRDSKT